jgi:hypothetical protein
MSREIRDFFHNYFVSNDSQLYSRRFAQMFALTISKLQILLTFYSLICFDRICCAT